MPASRPVVLASASPRRRELLACLLTDFEVLVSEVDEESLTTPDPHETAERLARAKATAVLAQRPDATVIGGDTVVALQAPDGWTQFAKPESEQEAVQMLMALSGREHIVVTGIAVACEDGIASGFDVSTVTFREIALSEAEAYVRTGEPMDKAGAYAIQGGAACFVAGLEGSLSNVIGLPLELLQRLMVTYDTVPETRSREGDPFV